MSIRPKVLSMAFIALMLPVAIPSVVENRAIAQSAVPEAIAQTQRSDQTDKQAITEIHRAWSVGIQRKDINQAYSNHAAEYIHIDADGKVINLKQARQEAQKSFSLMHHLFANFDIKEIQINGDTATVLGTAYVTGVVSDPKKPQASVPVSLVVQYRDTWKRKNSGWEIVKGHTLQKNIAVGQPQNNVSTDNQLPPKPIPPLPLLELPPNDGYYLTPIGPL